MRPGIPISTIVPLKKAVSTKKHIDFGRCAYKYAKFTIMCYF